jgi:hypothetical protein
MAETVLDQQQYGVTFVAPMCSAIRAIEGRIKVNGMLPFSVSRKTGVANLIGVLDVVLAGNARRLATSVFSARVKVILSMYGSWLPSASTAQK